MKRSYLSITIRVTETDLFHNPTDAYRPRLVSFSDIQTRTKARRISPPRMPLRKPFDTVLFVPTTHHDLHAHICP